MTLALGNRLPITFPVMLKLVIAALAALIVPVVVILPPDPAPVLNERLNPDASVTSPPALIAALWILPLNDKLLPLM